RGGVLYLETRPWLGSVGAASITYVDAELLEPPPATAEEPNPPFESGQNLPFVPPLVARVDVGVEHALGLFLNEPWNGRVGLGFSAISARPLPYGDFASPFALLDASLGVQVSRFSFLLDVFNVLDTRYSSSEYSYVSHWDPAQPPSRRPMRHVAAGAPRTIMGSIEVNL